MALDRAGLMSAPASTELLRLARLQRWRRGLQIGFFALFLLAPALNLLRFDLNEAQLWVLGQRWSLGIAAFVRGETTATQTALAIFARGILPVLLLGAALLTVAYRWGRLYCGWLCPHFSLVETLNDLLQRATGKLSLWDHTPTPHGARQPDRRWWPLFVASCAVFGFLWAITLLTYLLPPAQVWGNLLHGTLTPNQARFIGIGSALFTAEFLFARHLFCRFGCAVGLFQSLAWMANPKSLVVAFDRQRARDCRSCSTNQAPGGAACDHACPMRLTPRNIKRLMFACVQCGQCITECESSNTARQQTPNLAWTVGLDAVRETLKQRRMDADADADADAQAPRHQGP
jgi:ferredoxin-type protein NapH